MAPKNLNIIIFSTLGIIILLAGCTSQTGGLVKTTEPSKEQVTTSIISKVIDGDTVELSNGETIRLIGINAVERGQKCYSEATDRLKELVEQKEVSLESDVTDRDKYDRLLRYLYVDDVFVNLILIREGYANVYIVAPDSKYGTELHQAEELARQENGCLWEKSEAMQCIGILFFHWNAEGNDNENLNDEYVTLKNSCSGDVDMTSWTVKDEATHIYTFSQFTLKAQSEVILYTGQGTDTSDKLYWGKTIQAVWNNGGDTLYLRDRNGSLVLKYSYLQP